MNDKELNYVYSFKCKDELEHFNRLSDEEKGRIEGCIVDVIFDSFVKPADEDFVTARLMAKNGMERAFFWAASQALEKYLKAFLLMRGVGVKGHSKGHSVSELHHEACSVDRRPLIVDTKRHTAIKIHPNVSESIKQFSVINFINDVERYGSPDNRYNSFGIKFNSGYLFALDSYVFDVRGQIGGPSIYDNLRGMEQGLVEIFNEYNPWFVSEGMDLAELPNEDFVLMSSRSVTTLDILISSHAPLGSRFVLQWLDKKMKLPKKIQEHLKK